MKALAAFVAFCCVSTALPAVAASDYASVAAKIDRIKAGKLKPGSRVELTPVELITYAQHELPDGVRNPKLEITASGEATGSALVDFGKVGRAKGWRPGFLLSALLDGERPVSASVHVRSSDGQATIDVDRVSVSAITLDGATLDFLIKNLLMRLYPNAAVGKPFDLGYNIDRFEVEPRAVSVVIAK